MTNNIVNLKPKPKLARLECSACGASANAACDCGAAYVPAGTRAAAAVAASPGKSDRAIAAEIGVNRRTVVKARKQLVHAAPVEKRTGRDGKQRRVPRPQPEPKIMSGAEFRRREHTERLPVDIAREIVRPLALTGQTADPKALAKQHGISHVTFEKAFAIERAVQKVHDDYRIGNVVREHFAAKGRPEPVISNPVAEVNAFHRELVRFTADLSERLTTWIKSGPPIDADGKGALMQALYLCADECAALAKQIDVR